MASSLDVQTLLQKGGAHADRRNHEVAGLQAVANAHQIARVVDHLVQRILLLVAEAKLLESVRHGHSVHKTGYLHHTPCTNWHWTRLGKRHARTVIQLRLLLFDWIDHCECRCLENNDYNAQSTDFSYRFVDLEKDRINGEKALTPADRNGTEVETASGRRYSHIEGKIRVRDPGLTN